MVSNLANALATFRGQRFLRHEINLQMQFLELVGGGGADGRDTGPAQVAHIVEMPEEVVKKVVTPFGLVNTSQS